MDIADAIIERPHAFDADGVRYYLYPPTLGKTLVLERYIADIGFDIEIAQVNPYLEALSVAQSRRAAVARVIAIHTCSTKAEVIDEDLIEQRATIISQAATDEELASMLVLVMTHYSTQPFIEHLKLDTDRQNLERVRRAKKTKGSYTFGGKSIYGTIIDYACERYGWTMDYVVWGISYQNLQMLMADSVQSIYLTDEEQKNCHVPQSTDGIIINGDDPNAAAQLAEILKD